MLATNTSYLDVDEIARGDVAAGGGASACTSSARRNVMRLLEVVRGAATAPEVLATAIAVGRKIGKVPVVVGVCHGFVGNRMLRAARRPRPSACCSKARCRRRSTRR